MVQDGNETKDDSIDDIDASSGTRLGGAGGGRDVEMRQQRQEVNWGDAKRRHVSPVPFVPSEDVR